MGTTFSRLFGKGELAFAGAVLGVGFFTLPYVFFHVGVAWGALVLLVAAALNLGGLMLLADLVLARREHDHFLRVVRRELGPGGEMLAAAVFFGSLWGVLLSYFLMSGAMGTVLGTALGFPALGPMLQWSLWILVALMVSGGIATVGRMQAMIVPVVIACIAIIAVVSVVLMGFPQLPHIIPTPDAIITALGATFFALSGLSAVPEVRDVLGRAQNRLRGTIARGLGLVMLACALFVVAVLALAGSAVTPVALDALGVVGGPIAIVIGATLGLLSLFCATVGVGAAVMDTLMKDLRVRMLPAWALTVGVPILLVLMGARDVLDVILFTGGVGTSAAGMLLAISHTRARMSGELLHHALLLPAWVAPLVFLGFAAVGVVTIVG